MISRNAFLEALADAGQSKKVRKKVKDLSSDDFEYLIASLLAKAFKPEILDEFEKEPQKVRVIEG